MNLNWLCRLGIHDWRTGLWKNYLFDLCVRCAKERKYS